MKKCGCGGKLAEVDRMAEDATFLCEHYFTTEFDNCGEGHLMEIEPITAEVAKRIKARDIIALPPF